MSIVKVILFYSKRSKLSLEMKNMVDKYNIDMNTVCVDSKKIKELLLHDEKYNIEHIPSILAFYIPPNGKKKSISKLPFKVFTGKELITWFNQLVQNILRISQQQTSSPPDLGPGEDTTPIQIEEGDDYTDITPLRRTAPKSNGIVNSGGIPIQGGEAAMISHRVPSLSSRGAGPQTFIEPLDQTNGPRAGKKEIKNAGLSAKEIADQITRQREEYDESIENGKPYL